MNQGFDELLEIIRKPCACGKPHAISLKNMILGEGVLDQLPAAIESLGKFRHIALVADENTFRAAGQAVLSLVPAHAVVLNPEHLHANEIGVDQADRQIPADTDLILAVGSGTIHDISRYIAYLRHLPFVSVPTAASVDGFVSTVAAMTWHGVKRTLTAVGPSLMVADSAILKGAPRTLTAAGVGDLLGKYTALADWKIGRILMNEYYCEEIVRLEEEAVSSVVQNIPAIASSNAGGVELLQYALVLSGLAMQMAGNSRPASGAEHHISHLIEMHVLNPENEAFHGEKVGVATGLVLDEYHRLSALKEADLHFSPALYADEAEIRRVFGPLADEILKENEKNPLDGLEESALRTKWSEICSLLTALPTGDEVRRLISEVGGSTTLTDLRLPESMKDDLLAYSPLVRNRLTLMRIRNHLR